ncbi:MAG: hypothetical protein IANPNBLG_02263 [Bryobacteraceae bacterium]|nr:hypothetical protein [Bryobacteraceae bacterium]
MPPLPRFALLFPSLVFLTAAFGQSSRGTVNGRATDPSTAVISGATVELLSVTTGVRRQTISNESGYYRFDAVDLGNYEVIVTASGFRQLKTAPFEVVANQVRTVDTQLEVGEQKNVVQVVAEAVQLQVEAPVRGANVGPVQITRLPVPARNPVALALTAPGVSSNRSAPGVATFAVNGARGRSNNFLIDGTENNDISVAGQGFQITNPDAVEEVSVQTSNFDAEYGRAGGAVVNVITRAGTNAYHGSASFLLDVTNDDATTLLQSLDPSVTQRGKPLPGADQWWGGTLGGPLVRNRLFFFQAFQQRRQRSSGSSDVAAPDAGGRATLNALFPKGTNPRVDLFNAVTAGLSGEANRFPVALGNGRPDIGFGLAITSYPQTLRDRQTTTRIDYALSERNQLSGRYLYDDTLNPVSAINLPGFITSQRNRYQNALASWTRVISPSMTNELRLPYNRIGLSFPNDAADPLAQSLPLYSIAGLTASTVGRSIGGYMGVQTNLPQGRIANNYGLQDTFSSIRGSHSFRMGAELLLQRSRQYAPIAERGRIVYAASAGYTGFANFVDDFGGSGGSVQRDFGSPAYYPNLFRQAYFAQDRWRVRPSLTLTLGIRYEYFGLPMNSLRTPAYEGIFNIDPVAFTGPYSLPNQVRADKNNFSPAFGLAWSPTSERAFLERLLGKRKTVIRTGFQMGYDSFFNNIASNAATSTPNVVVAQAVSTVSEVEPRGTPNLSTTLPIVPRPFSALDGQNVIWKTLVNPYYERWSFGIQRELTPSTVLDVSYVGSKGTKLFASEQFNPVVPASMRIFPTTPAPIPPDRAGTRYDPLSGSRAIRTNNGSSIYHSLQVNLSKRASNGFFGSFAYTWSKLLDYGSEIFSYSNAAAASAVPTIFGGLPAERGVSLFDRTHRAVIVYGYDLPWMRTRKGALGLVASGWSVSGITSFETGVPVTVNNGVDADGIDGANDRPDFNPQGRPGTRAVPSPGSSTGYVNPDLPGQPPIDPAAAQYIALPPNASPDRVRSGNLARNTFRSAPMSNWDVNLFKRVNITERLRAELRTEFYNIWNHPQRGLGSVSPFAPAGSTPSSNVTSSAAGQFLNLGILDGGGRVIRYQLKFIF